MSTMKPRRLTLSNALLLRPSARRSSPVTAIAPCTGACFGGSENSPVTCAALPEISTEASSVAFRPLPAVATWKFGVRRHKKQARRLVVEGEARLAHREFLQRRRLVVAQAELVGEAAQEVVLVLVLLDAEPEAPRMGAHQGELDANERDALDDGLAVEQRTGREVDVGLRRLGDDAAFIVVDLGAQDHEVDPALVARPFDRGLVVAHSDAGQRLGQRVRQRVAEGPERDRPDQQADHRADGEEDHGRADAAGDERRAADVMCLDVPA